MNLVHCYYSYYSATFDSSAICIIFGYVHGCKYVDVCVYVYMGQVTEMWVSYVVLLRNRGNEHQNYTLVNA